MIILADASLPQLEALFPPPFILKKYQHQEQIPELLSNVDILLCRSTLKVTAQILKAHSLRCVATASSGSDHLDLNFLQQQGILILDAKGCNAHAVADYMSATLAYLMQSHIINGNNAGIIGLGAVGTAVDYRLKQAGFEILYYDPWRNAIDTERKYSTLTELTQCDLLCIHANLHDNLPYPSRHLLNAQFIKQLKPGSILINAARGGIVDECALLETAPYLIYCTDVYNNEPFINSKIIEKATLCTPHIAGHSIEAKLNAVSTISQKLHAYFNIPFSGLLSSPPLIPSVITQANWQKTVLDLYNPIEETSYLKKAKDKTEAFLELRQKHQFRHDFL